MFIKLLISFLLGFSYLIASDSIILDKKYKYIAELTRLEVYKHLANGVNSVNVSVMKDGKIVYAESFGARNRETGELANLDTKHNIGSVSKMFATVGILSLVDQGKVNIDEPVYKYLPEFQSKDERYKNITVRMLLNHTSGLMGTNYKNAFRYKKDTNRQEYYDETLKRINDEGLKYNPGEFWVYTNDGFTIADMIIEKVSGQKIEDFYSNMFKKIGMKNSSAGFYENELNYGYFYDNKNPKGYPKETIDNILGAGGISSTANDLAVFANTLIKGNFLSPKSKEELFTITKANDELQVIGSNLKLGWDTIFLNANQDNTFKKYGVTVFNKGGDTLKYHANILIAKEPNIAITFTSSSGSSMYWLEISNKILKQMLNIKTDTDLSLIQDNTSNIKTPDADKIFVGKYAILTEIIDIKLIGEDLYYSMLGDKNKTKLIYNQDGYYYINPNTRLKLISHNKEKYIIKYIFDDYKNMQLVNVYALVGAKKINAANFDNKNWLISNMLKYESIVFSAYVTTQKNKDIDGFLDVSLSVGGQNMEFKAKLKDEFNTEIFNKLQREYYVLSLDKKTKEINFYRNNYENTNGIKLFSTDEIIIINTNAKNEWRRADKKLYIKPLQNKRIIVLSSTGDLQYDSFVQGDKEFIIKEGSYIGFIGESNETFERLFVSK